MSDKIAYARHGDIAVLTIQNPPVNALSHAVRQGFMDRMDQAETDSGVRAVMIVGEGRAFIAGADITEFGKPPMAPALPDVINRIETSPLIVVASLHGVSLGGGLEVFEKCSWVVRGWFGGFRGAFGGISSGTVFFEVCLSWNWFLLLYYFSFI